jgi:hypothetical protein
MGVVPGPEKMNDTCRKTVHMGTMDRGFTVYMFGQKSSVYAMAHTQHNSCVSSFLEFSVHNVVFSTSLHIAILLLSVSN